MIRTWAARAPASVFSTAAPSSAPSKHSCSSMPRSVRIAVVGDVHDDWNLEEDSKALHFLQPDLVLFTGDFGNENVELVRSLSDLKIPKAVILGNHDCWRTHHFSHKKADRVQLQLEWYGVKDMNESAKKVYKAAVGTPDDHSIIFLGHNGPTGLGSDTNDICGRDWFYEGGDHGDPDLAQAISDLKSHTKFPIPLVVFGHMHSQLQYGSALRKMVAVGYDHTVYLNGALVPRVKYGNGSSSESNESDQDELRALKSKDASLRAFTLVEMLEGKVEKISQMWVLVDGDKYAVEAEKILFKSM